MSITFSPLTAELVDRQNLSQQLRFWTTSTLRFNSRVFSGGLFIPGLQCRIVVLIIFFFHVLMRKMIKEWMLLFCFVILTLIVLVDFLINDARSSYLHCAQLGIVSFLFLFLSVSANE